MRRNLLILGASARAAAWSAGRAGFSVVAADRFGDRDLRQLGKTYRVGQFPDDFESISTHEAPGPWLYTGGLENHPEVVDRIARARTLWGNAGDVLRHIRGPVAIYRALREAGLPCPEVCGHRPSVSNMGNWLRKPLRSGGGIGIERVAPGPQPPANSPEVYYQRYVPGKSHSAVFVAAAHNARLLGVTRQLVGADWDGSGSGEFGYVGSCGPVTLTPWQRDRWSQVGQCLSERFGLRGLFGVDAVLSDGDIWPVEVNPRYTASVEVLERGSGLRAITQHARACSRGHLPQHESPAATQCVGKAILYARHEVIISSHFDAAVTRLNAAAGDIQVADIPCAGQRIRRGHPVLTILLTAPSPRQVQQQLRSQTAQWQRRLEASFDGGVVG